MSAVRTSLLALALVLTASAPAAGAPVVKAFELTGQRVHLGDVLAKAPSAAASVDLGPTPPPGGSRLIDRVEIEKAIRDAGVEEPKQLPSAVRVVRKMKKLDAAHLERVVREALAGVTMPRGATLAAVRAPKSTEVADAWGRVTVDLPRPPRRKGNVTVSALVSFFAGDEVIEKVLVPLELTLDEQATIPDIARGASLVLTVRRGLIEVSATGTAGTDADIGSVFPVTVKPSGRVIRARLVDGDHALALEES